MSSQNEYQLHVISNYYTVGIIWSKKNMSNQLTTQNDCPKNWNMLRLECAQDRPWWKCGYINNRNVFSNPLSVAEQLRWDERHLVGITPYWWCRDGDWLPYWGKKTEMRAQLMKELRAYWVNEWFGKTIPKIKNILLETTKLIPDIVEEIPTYFEYPYQIKTR